MRGPIPYIGGKARLAERLVALIPPHDVYVEPFCGGAQVFFHKPPSRTEVLNDLDGELVNFLRVCQQHHPELVRWLRFAVHSRELHQRHLRQDPALLTDIQRAARFLYLQRTSWAGKVTGQTYHHSLSGGGRVVASNLKRVLLATSRRLARVQIENWPYERVLSTYDRPTTFFYLDPPYVEMPYYRFNFKTAADFELLATRLEGLRGKFLLSLNDHPTARAVFRPFHSMRVSVPYGTARGRESSELLISNFPLPCGSNI